MAWIRTDILKILYYITLLIIMACAIGEDEANTTDEKSKVVVFRSSARGPDKVEICPTKSGEESHLRSIERKSMLCSETNATSCSRLGGETCTCRQSSPNYVVSQKKCVSNEWLRQGMSGHFRLYNIKGTINLKYHIREMFVSIQETSRRNNISWFVYLQETDDWETMFPGLSTFRKHGQETMFFGFSIFRKHG